MIQSGTYMLAVLQVSVGYRIFRPELLCGDTMKDIFA